jgi:hydrogenase maturation protease
MKGSKRPEIIVAAVGNPDRGDDGFGPAVADRLRGALPAGVRLVECGGDVLRLIDEWGRSDAVIVIDAAASIGHPGRVHRVDLADRQPLAAPPRASTHALGVAEAVELARSLGRLPGSVIVYLAEGECFDVAAPLSPPVAAAVDRVAACALAEVLQMAPSAE